MQINLASSKRLLVYFCFLYLIGLTALSYAEKVASSQAVSIALPGGEGGIGFDDFTYSSVLKKVLVPGGQTGNLYLVDSKTHEVTAIPGFSSEEKYLGGHGHGITSADYGNDLIFVVDRNTKLLNAVDSTNKIIASAPLASSPDYVRYIPEENEVWVTEPDHDRIETFGITKTEKITLSHSDFIAIEGGPESLIYDFSRKRAYTHLWAGKTVDIDVKTRKVIAVWPNGCNGSRGIALDPEFGFLFAGCAEGKATVLDLNHEGKLIGNLKTGSGIDIISYNPNLKHLYLPSSKSATLTIAQVSKEGHLHSVQELKIEKHSHCAASDDIGHVWVCDPERGKLFLFSDAD